MPIASSDKLEVLQSKVLSEAVSAAVIAQNFHYLGDMTNTGAENQALANHELIRCLHPRIVECMRHFTVLSEECGEPLGNGAKKKPLLERNREERDNWHRINTVTGMLASAFDEVARRINSGIPSAGINLDEGGFTKGTGRQAMRPVYKELSEIILIASYFTDQRKPALRDNSREIFEEIQSILAMSAELHPVRPAIGKKTALLRAPQDGGKTL